MTTIQVVGELVTASSAEFPVENDRQKWYKILPYGEQSAVMASGHQFSVDGPGRVTLPADPGTAHVNEEHDRKRPVGKFSQFKETVAGLFGRVDYSQTTAGNDALVLASEGLRTGISVELDSPVIRAGKFFQGVLTGAGAVVTPSFGSARVLAAAADIGEVTEAIEAALKLLNSPEGGESENPPADPDKDKETPPVTATAVTPPATSAAVLAAALAGQALTPAPNPVDTFLDHLATISSMSSPSVKAAALDQIIQPDLFDKTSQPEWSGEIWKGRRYLGRYLDLFTPATMKSQKVKGWRWITGKTPQVSVWTPPFSGGTMNDIPTNEVAAEDAEWTGFRVAGGNKFDRIHFDFPDREWWQSYLNESTDDYARKLDAECIKFLTAPERLTALELSAAATTEEMMLEGIGLVTDFSNPGYILLGWSKFKELALAKKFDQSVAAASGGDMSVSLTNGAFTTTYMGIPVKAAGSSDVAATNRVIVGCKEANELQSLPGGPIRVEAQEIQKGAVEHGVFGYHMFRDLDKRGMVEVKKAAA
jgi:hypothetical protein